MNPKVCVSITGKNAVEMLEQAKKAVENKVDIVELRLDFLEKFSEEEAIRTVKNVVKLGVPVIATIMSSRVGGHFPASADRKRASVLVKLALYADYVDVGMEMSGGLRRECIASARKNASIIVSYHNPEGTPNCQCVVEILSKELGEGADVCKAVFMARKLEDNLEVLKACTLFRDGRKVCFCYGPLGFPSRVLAPFFGSEWVYASLSRGLEAAPGQIDVSTLVKVYELLGRYCLVG